MRIWAVIGILGLLPGGEVALGEPIPRGDYSARIRVNDFPVGGRLTVHAYMLDSLDAVIEGPGPGRVLAVGFSEANGKNSFLVPGDLALEGFRRQLWSQGFLPLGTERLGGHLTSRDVRWALWWVPWGTDSLVWQSPEELVLTYGFSRSGFSPLGEKEVGKALGGIPWNDARRVTIDGDRPSGQLTVPPNPAAFDVPPRVDDETTPEYPETARMFDFEGSVHVVAVVDATGLVTDAFVLHSTAPHLLNVSALAAVMDWTFKPGEKGGEPVAGEFVIPVHFSLGSSR
jgi:protein TonB